MSNKTSAELIQEAIYDLEAKLGLKAGESFDNLGFERSDKNDKEGELRGKRQNKKESGPFQSTKDAGAVEQPEICKLEFKVGQILNVWNHPEAEKLYCEEIDVGEVEPRLIASGLRPHYALEQMHGQRLIVVCNLKPRNLVGFKSFGMVLCASKTKDDGSEYVEFVEPPMDAKIGELVTFEGLPPPEPLSAAQVEKKKVFLNCLEGMKTLEDGRAAWNGHIFMTSTGPCRAKTVCNAPMR